MCPKHSTLQEKTVVYEIEVLKYCISMLYKFLVNRIQDNSRSCKTKLIIDLKRNKSVKAIYSRFLARDLFFLNREGKSSCFAFVLSFWRKTFLCY